MRHITLLKYFLFLLPFINVHCTGTTESEYSYTNIIYFNSFENENDLMNWDGLTVQNLIDNPSPYGGKYSVQISGGCIVPHASLTLGAPGKDMIVTLEFYGKNLAIGGCIQLIIGKDYSESCCVTVNDTAWKKYRSDQLLKWPADSILSIWMSSGGIVASSMLIDELKIIKIN